MSVEHLPYQYSLIHYRLPSHLKNELKAAKSTPKFDDFTSWYKQELIIDKFIKMSEDATEKFGNHFSFR